MPVFACGLPEVQVTTLAGCLSCPLYRQGRQATTRAARANYTTTPKTLSSAAGAFTTPTGQPVPLEGRYHGAGLFLALAGPSLQTLDLHLLNQRGVVVMAVNNAATVVRPHLWTAVDPCGKFHHVIWHDPAILKLVAWGRRKDRLRVKTPAGFVDDGRKAMDCPGVVCYRRSASFEPATYLASPDVNWGNDQKAAARNGWPHVLNVMFAALKQAYLLGFRRVYLLGCDFHMEAGQVNYAFAQARSAGAVRCNNAAYAKLNQMLAQLVPGFDKANFCVYNTNKQSGLTAFPYLAYTDAIHAETQAFRTIDASGWYEKSDDAFFGR